MVAVCIVLLKGHEERGQVFTLAHNKVVDIVQARLLHRVSKPGFIFNLIEVLES